MSKENFYIYTADHSGLPLAMRLKEEGHKATLVAIKPQERRGKIEPPKTPEEAKSNEKRIKYLKKNGNGLVEKAWASGVSDSIRPSDLVVFDQIYGWQYGEQLRRRGVGGIQGGTKNGYILETKRRDVMAMFEAMGYSVPGQKYFGPGSSKRGIEFLKGVKDNTLYVLKSDNPKIVTKVADFENEELIQKLIAEAKDIDTDGFLLQEKIEGIEAALEKWYVNGKPILTNVDIEAKKKYNEMSEIQTGCAMDIVFMLPNKHPLCERVIDPIDWVAKKYFGTCILDLSFIYEPVEDKIYPLEMCGNRLAYNAFYSMLALLEVPVGEFLVKYLRGEYKKDISEEVFRSDSVAASLRVFNEDKMADQLIMIPDEYKKNLWLWDVYNSDGKLLTTGDESLGIISTAGENPESALAKVREVFYKLQMPTKWARDDFDNDDYPSLPLSRYHELKRLGLF